jgi:hypothetical protein
MVMLFHQAFRVAKFLHGGIHGSNLPRSGLRKEA